MATIWVNQTFTRPLEGWPASGLIVASDVINRGQTIRSVRVTVDYQVYNPNGATTDVGYTVQAFVEEELAPGIYNPVASQFDPTKDASTKAKQILQLSRDVNLDSGVAEGIAMGGVITTQINRTQGVLPPKYRVAIYRNLVNGSLPDLNSLTLSAYYAEYD